MLRHPSNSYVLSRLNDSRLTAILQDLGRLAAAKAVRREVPSLRPTHIAQSPLGSNRIWEGVTARTAYQTVSVSFWSILNVCRSTVLISGKLPKKICFQI